MCFGLVLVLIGANQAALAQDLGLDLERTGLLGSLLGLGLGLGVVIAGPLFDRYSRRGLFIGSTGIAALALLGVDESMGFTRLALHVVATGFGIGAYDTLINATVIEGHAERSPRTMSAVHAAATLGAMAGPPIVGGFFADDWAASFRWTGGSHLLLATWAAFVHFPSPRARGRRRGSDNPRVLSLGLLPFAVVGFAYVGIEATLTVFAVPYASFAGQSDADGRLAITTLWLGLLAGRLAVLLRSRIPDARSLTRSGLIAAALLGAGIGLGLPQVEALFALVGFALGSVYPVAVALAGQRAPHAPGSAAGAAAGVGALGGFAVPWLTGAVADTHDLALALGALALWSLVISAAAITASRQVRSPHSG